MAVIPLRLLVCWSAAVQIIAGLLDCSSESCVIECSGHVAVDLESARDCRQLSGVSVINSTCNSLQDVLNGLALLSGYSEADCISVTLSPGTHTLTRHVAINQSLALSGTLAAAAAAQVATTPPPLSPNPPPTNQPTLKSAEVTEYDTKIQFSDELLPSNVSTTSPFYVMSFVGGALLSMATLQMTGGPGAIEIVNVSNVIISNCSFSFFPQGALDVYNCHSVSVTNCDFFHNGPVHVVKTQEFRGHAGGLSLGYDHNDALENSPQASVESCVFYNNTATDNGSYNQVLIARVFPGHGGGLSVLVNSVTMVTVTITNCDFFHNYASSFGGGAYITLSGLSCHLITFQSCDFVENLSGSHAGGLGIGFQQSGNEELSNRVIVRACLFLGNEAQYGGAVYVFYVMAQGRCEEERNEALFEECEFEHNLATEIGAAFGAVSQCFYDNKEDFTPLLVTNSTFTGNEALKGATVGIAFFPLTFSGVNTFEDNRGPSLVVIGSVLRVYGELIFKDNNLMGLGGGTLYVLSQGQVRLMQSSRLVFDNNKGVLGSATVIETLHIANVFSSLLHNKLCFLQYEDTTLSPLLWHTHNVSVEYRRNAAIVGSAVFTDSLRQCSWISLSPPHFDLTGTFHWPFITLDGNDNRAHRPNGTDLRWAAQTSAFQVNIVNTTVSAFAGDDITLGIEAKDELGEATPTILRLSHTTKDQVVYKFTPSTLNYDRLEDGVIKTSFLQLSNADGITHNITMETLLTEPLKDEFSLSSELCPAGYTLTPHPTLTEFSVCSCDIDHDSIIDCEGRKIILEDGLWGFVDKGKMSSRDPLETYPCPLGYCRCEFRTEGSTEKCRYRVDDRNVDEQCVCDREGVLCGSCREGKGVTVLKGKCATCHDGFTGFIAGLIIGDAVVMVIMLLLMIPLPAVLLPGIFYLQILPYLSSHFPVTFEKVHPFLLYVSSAVGLYFPYDLCLYGNMSMLVSHSLHYLPLLVAMVVTPLVLFIRHVTHHPAPMHGVAWITILLYTPLLHTSLTALQCPLIRAGDQQCYTGGHIPLAVVAILVIILLLAAIAAVILLSLHKIKSSRLSSHLFVAPFSHMYSSGCEWWFGGELARRLLLVLFIVAFPGNNYPAYFVLAVLVTVQAYVQPYRRALWNVLELVMSINVLVLLLIRNTDYIESSLQTYSEQSGEGGSGGGGGGAKDMKCSSDDIDGVTPFVMLLAVIYYIPLLLFITVAVVWMALGLWSIPYVNRMKLSLFSKPAVEEATSSLSLPQPLAHAATSTMVDLDELYKTTPPEDSAGDDSRISAGSRKSSRVHIWMHNFRRKLASPPTSPTSKTPTISSLHHDITVTSNTASPSPLLSVTNPLSATEQFEMTTHYSVVSPNEQDTPPEGPFGGVKGDESVCPLKSVDNATLTSSLD